MGSYKLKSVVKIYSAIQNAFLKGEKLIAVLIDPGKIAKQALEQKLDNLKNAPIDFIFLGGSLVNESVSETRQLIQEQLKLPVILFPGSLLQLDFSADALLLLSLLSGRNADLLIGNHVIAAPIIRKSGIETISTAYLLIDGGKQSTVQYISNSQPIARDKTEIVVATSIAAEMLGFQLIYLEAGSGALQNVPASMVAAVRENTKLPVVVGGGIKDAETMYELFNAGADIIVLGTIFESEMDIASKIQDVKKRFFA